MARGRALCAADGCMETAKTRRGVCSVHEDGIMRAQGFNFCSACKYFHIGHQVVYDAVVHGLHGGETGLGLVRTRIAQLRWMNGWVFYPQRLVQRVLPEYAWGLVTVQRYPSCREYLNVQKVLSYAYGRSPEGKADATEAWPTEVPPAPAPPETPLPAALPFTRAPSPPPLDKSAPPPTLDEITKKKSRRRHQESLALAERRAQERAERRRLAEQRRHARRILAERARAHMREQAKLRARAEARARAIVRDAARERELAHARTSRTGAPLRVSRRQRGVKRARGRPRRQVSSPPPVLTAEEKQRAEEERQAAQAVVRAVADSIRPRVGPEGGACADSPQGVVARAHVKKEEREDTDADTDDDGALTADDDGALTADDAEE